MRTYSGPDPGCGSRRATAAVCVALYADRRGARLGAAGVGVALLGWLAVEAVAGFDRPTLWLNLATALAILVLTAGRTVRADLGGPAAD
ncbi:hypothetical protein DM2_914 [Halorubrum sp. DM2]|uniref:hypothetical protein n=1 Tax=Halorubrum sp. DM2 TaxID=2527867 RepID=UPI0024B6924B|nr:hypothetical protein [Halorubrum sp. DM2]VTT87580.1 hypothetical protein DM2_914 [Halorubrum sp. DM2]